MGNGTTGTVPLFPNLNFVNNNNSYILRRGEEMFRFKIHQFFFYSEFSIGFTTKVVMLGVVVRGSSGSSKEKFK